MPYAIIRLTWPTPWPQGAPGGPDSIGDGVRASGILLGLAALGCAVLTLGLISRRGDVFPARRPGLRGRLVPVLAAVVPAALVATVLCASSISMIMMSTRDGAGCSSPRCRHRCGVPRWGSPPTPTTGDAPITDDGPARNRRRGRSGGRLQAQGGSPDGSAERTRQSPRRRRRCAGLLPARSAGAARRRGDDPQPAVFIAAGMAAGLGAWVAAHHRLARGRFSRDGRPRGSNAADLSRAARGSRAVAGSAPPRCSPLELR